MTEVRPQLLPGRRRVGCPLLQVCVENTFHSWLYSEKSLILSYYIYLQWRNLNFLLEKMALPWRQGKVPLSSPQVKVSFQAPTTSLNNPQVTYSFFPLTIKVETDQAGICMVSFPATHATMRLSSLLALCICWKTSLQPDCYSPPRVVSNLA